MTKIKQINNINICQMGTTYFAKLSTGAILYTGTLDEVTDFAKNCTTYLARKENPYVCSTKPDLTEIVEKNQKELRLLHERISKLDEERAVLEFEMMGCYKSIRESEKIIRQAKMALKEKGI